MIVALDYYQQWPLVELRFSSDVKRHCFVAEMTYQARIKDTWPLQLMNNDQTALFWFFLDHVKLQAVMRSAVLLLASLAVASATLGFDAEQASLSSRKELSTFLSSKNYNITTHFVPIPGDLDLDVHVHEEQRILILHLARVPLQRSR